MDAFEYTQLPSRVVFGYRTLARVADEMGLIGCGRAFVLSDAHHVKGATAKLLQVLGDRAVGVSSDAAMHTPVEVTEHVLEPVSNASPDCLVSLGAGRQRG
jgi:maleylacetate reductase